MQTQTTLFQQIESERAYLMRYALSKLRDEDAAEDVVQECLLGALSGAQSFEGNASLRTWLTGILKFKIIDFQRRVSADRERFAVAPATAEDENEEWLDKLFDETGHWRQEFAVWTLPDAAHEQKEFFAAFERCMDKLPAATARVFFQREVLGEETESICKDQGITSSNCWVMLHRARVALRECLDMNWFGKTSKP
jgi:RNA polymerase sigma-70 factor, ECF subfamily